MVFEARRQKIVGVDYELQLLEHFSTAAEDEKMHGIKNDTRAMVFCSFRDCVLEVVVSGLIAEGLS